MSAKILLLLCFCSPQVCMASRMMTVLEENATTKVYSSQRGEECLAQLQEIYATTSATVPPALIELLRGESAIAARVRAELEQSIEAYKHRQEACGEACTDPVTAEAAMQAAIKAAELTVTVVSELTKYIISEIKEVRDEISAWESKLAESADVDIHEYTVRLAKATVTINNAEAKARALYQGLLDMTELIVENLEEDLEKEDWLEGIKSAQEAMAITLESSIEELSVLLPQVTQAQLEFAEIGALSADYERKIEDNMNNKDGWLDAKKAHLRAVVYGSCAATCLAPPACALCFAIGAPILETKLAELDEDLKASKAALKSISGRFSRLKGLCDDMSGEAQKQHDDMVAVDSKLRTSLKIVSKSTKKSWWKGYVLRDLRKLMTLLEDKLGHS